VFSVAQSSSIHERVRSKPLRSADRNLPNPASSSWASSG
jgi:hypothetical protein